MNDGDLRTSDALAEEGKSAKIYPQKIQIAFPLKIKILLGLRKDM
ncbi:MAG: hypothetical protein ACYCSO_10300 [Cuniculiplasma sp.]